MPVCKVGSVMSIKNAAGTGCTWERTANGMARVVQVNAVKNNFGGYGMSRKNRKDRKNRKGTRKNRKNKKATRKNRKDRK